MDNDGESARILEDQIDRLETTLSGTGTMVAEFDGELRRMRSSLAETSASVSNLSNSVSRGLRRSFDGLIFDGMKLSDAMENVARSILNATYSAALNPVTDRLGELIGGAVAGIGAVPFAQGGSFSQGRVMPFAKGGVVTGPTVFPMRGGTGLMGEAGPEAIMPLTRAADGSLGVKAQGNDRGATNVTINVATPDVAGFERSQTQIAARMSRLLSRGQRNR